MTNIYLRISKSGQVYDQTFGKNKKLIRERINYLKGGDMLYVTEVRKELYIVRTDRTGKERYRRKIEFGKDYISTPLGCDLHFKRSRYVNNAYYFCKENVGVTNDIIITDNISKPYSIDLIVNHGVVDYRLNITINEKAFDNVSYLNLVDDISRINKINFKKFIKHYNAITTVITVDETMFDIVETLGFMTDVGKIIKLA